MTKQMMIVVVLCVYILIQCIFIEPNSLEVVKYQVEDSKLQGIKVVFLTDFHLKRTDYSRMDRIIKLANAQNPDLFLLGGDFAGGRSERTTMNPKILAQKLALLKAPTYAILGDSDTWANGDRIKDALQANGIKVLENSNVGVVVKYRYVYIVGLEDLQTHTPKIARAMKGAKGSRIVLTHNPDVYFDIVDKTSLILAGHTHGGQFIIPFTKPIMVSSKYGSDFASGLIKKTANIMIISKGLGTVGLPVRWNCKPEITVIEFVRNGAGTGMVKTTKTTKTTNKKK